MYLWASSASPRSNARRSARKRQSDGRGSLTGAGVEGASCSNSQYLNRTVTMVIDYEWHVRFIIKLDVSKPSALDMRENRLACLSRLRCLYNISHEVVCRVFGRLKPTRDPAWSLGTKDEFATIKPRFSTRHHPKNKNTHDKSFFSSINVMAPPKSCTRSPHIMPRKMRYGSSIVIRVPNSKYKSGVPGILGGCKKISYRQGSQRS
jgi:hypothetical protein